jgi:hypothetical protein
MTYEIYRQFAQANAELHKCRNTLENLFTGFGHDLDPTRGDLDAAASLANRCKAIVDMVEFHCGGDISWTTENLKALLEKAAMDPHRSPVTLENDELRATLYPDVYPDADPLS